VQIAGKEEEVDACVERGLHGGRIVEHGSEADRADLEARGAERQTIGQARKARAGRS
jgi:hypothetical protein